MNFDLLISYSDANCAVPGSRLMQSNIMGMPSEDNRKGNLLKEMDDPWWSPSRIRLGLNKLQIWHFALTLTTVILHQENQQVCFFHTNSSFAKRERNKHKIEVLVEMEIKTHTSNPLSTPLQPYETTSSNPTFFTEQTWQALGRRTTRLWQTWETKHVSKRPKHSILAAQITSWLGIYFLVPTCNLANVEKHTWTHMTKLYHKVSARTQANYLSK